MSLINWTTEEFGTNVTIADDQHKVLFGLLNDLHDAVPAGGPCSHWGQAGWLGQLCRHGPHLNSNGVN